MIVRMDEAGRISLTEAEDFRRFDVHVAQPQDRLAAVTAAFTGLAAFDDAGQAWVDAAGLMRLAPPGAEWATAFEAMVTKARAHGWIRDAPLRVAAHVMWQA